MSITQSYRFFEPSQLPQNIVWTLIGIGGGKILDLFWQPKQIKLSQIKRSIRWFRIIGYMISFLVAGYIGDFFEFVGLKRVTKLCWKIMLYDIVSGFKVFFMLEPDAARSIMKEIEKI